MDLLPNVEKVEDEKPKEIITNGNTSEEAPKTSPFVEPEPEPEPESEIKTTNIKEEELIEKSSN